MWTYPALTLANASEPTTARGRADSPAPTPVPSAPYTFLPLQYVAPASATTQLCEPPAETDWGVTFTVTAVSTGGVTTGGAVVLSAPL